MDGTECNSLAILLAQTAFKYRYFWATLGLVGLLLLGALVIALLNRWRKSPGSEGLSAGDQLSHFRELHAQGTISKEEFDQIRTRLAGELRKEMNLEPAPEVPPPSDALTQRLPGEMTLPQPPSEDSKPQ